MRSKRLTIVIGFLTAAVLAIAACTSDAPEATRVPTPEFNPTPAGGSAAPAPTATQAPADTGDPVATEVPAGPSGDPVNGEALFTANACSGCHATSEAKVIGPGLGGIKDRAGTRVAGQSAEEYVRESITSPSAFVVEDFPDSVMPSTFGVTLSEDEIDDVIAYLFTLE